MLKLSKHAGLKFLSFFRFFSIYYYRWGRIFTRKRTASPPSSGLAETKIPSSSKLLFWQVNMN